MEVKQMTKFDHSGTNFKLEDKHKDLSCKSCHKTKFTDPVKHGRCLDCHKDYHENQLTEQGSPRDCSACHSTRGFAGSSFTIEQHNEGSFKLAGAHLATPCFECHKKEVKWKFREIGKNCSDCHENIHEAYIDKKYYPEANCENCHSADKWNLVKFDHSLTSFSLAGAHAEVSCRSCHFVTGLNGEVKQRFSGLSVSCGSCHSDNHNRQFEVNGITDCLRCHEKKAWVIPVFDHNRTDFKLDGKHEKVQCYKCHKTITEQQITYVLYKIKETKCVDCHH